MGKGYTARWAWAGVWGWRMNSGHNGQTALMNGHPGRLPLEATKSVYARLRAIVLLKGSLRKSVLSHAVNRSLLDLPVSKTQSILSLWQDHADDLAAQAGLDSLPLRIVLAQTGHQPAIPVPKSRVRLTVERDSKDFRGTGGVLRDLASSYAPDDLILVANAAQVLIEPLAVLATDLFRAGGSVSFIGHRDGTPCGLFLVRCAALSSIREVGFLDFKEQVLPKLGASGHQVRALMRDTATGLPVRTLGGYLAGLRSFTRLRENKPIDTGPFGEDWSPTFNIIEPEAVVDSSATIHDSVVLNGARVGRKAVIVRSVLGPGAVVQEGQTLADQALGAPDDAPARRGGVAA